MKQNIKLQISRLLFIALVAGILAVNSMFILEYIRTDDSNKILDVNKRFNEMNSPRVPVPDNNRNQKISIELLRQLIDSRSAIIVDARLTGVYGKGHIPGAVNISALRPAQKVIKEILKFPSHTTIITYCESDNCSDSLTVAELLKDKGMNDVRVFEGGLQQWKEYGLPLESK